MLLSVDNFKSIEHVSEIDICALTVLAGINSSGKSSLIQALMLLKQTVCSSNSEMRMINGPYVYANSLIDLMYNKKYGNNLYTYDSKFKTFVEFRPSRNNTYHGTGYIVFE